MCQFGLLVIALCLSACKNRELEFVNKNRMFCVEIAFVLHVQEQRKAVHFRCCCFQVLFYLSVCVCVSLLNVCRVYVGDLGGQKRVSHPWSWRERCLCNLLDVCARNQV